ncbi:MAG: Ig-like domain-containing protein [Elusimicrobia bacterium]|nr:Ig-like domain-containing protein [Elusimicrobiota bacterium]
MGNVVNIVVGLQSDNTVKMGDYGSLESAALDAGFIKGGVLIEHEETQHEVKVDQSLGAVRKVTTDEAMKVKMSLAEPSLANMAAAFGYGSDAVSGGSFSFGDNQNEVYKTLYVNVKGPGPGARKYTFWKTRPTGKTSQAYKKDGETVIDVEFEIMCDTTKPAGQRFGKVEDTGFDAVAPVVAMTTPEQGGVRTSGTKQTVVLTFTEAGLMNEGSIVYGDTVQILKEDAPATLVEGDLVYDGAAKTATFMPSSNWVAGTYQVVVSTGVADAAGNRLASAYVSYFTV